MDKMPHATTIKTNFSGKRAVFFDIFSKFGVSILTSGVALLGNILLFPHLHNSPFLLFPIAIALSSWYGRLWTGVSATIFSSIGIFYFFLFKVHIPLPRQLNTIEEIFIFILEGVLISIVIDICIRSNKVTGYKDREKALENQISILANEASKAKEEIKARD